MFVFCPDFLLLPNGQLAPQKALWTTELGEVIKITAINELESMDNVGSTNIFIRKINGVLTPGFINAHCHLELSHLKGVIPPGTGLPNFLLQITKNRQTNPDAQITAAQTANQYMHERGIVAVGDISNGPETFLLKSKTAIAYHTFIELLTPFGANLEQRTKAAINHGIDLYRQAQNLHLPASLAPHAPYTITGNLLTEIIQFNAQNNPDFVTTVHNQECAAENELYLQGTGSFSDLYANLGTDILQYFTPPKISSIRFMLQYIPKNTSVLWVHNTTTSAADIKAAHAHTSNSFWCTCPNANLYIEGLLPNYPNFIAQNAVICVGTDSLASNYELCILSELKTITKYYPDIPLESLLIWATANGAKALKLSHRYGSFEVGKTPGLCQIYPICQHPNGQLALTAARSAQSVDLV